MVVSSVNSSGNSAAPAYAEGLSGRIFFGNYTSDPLAYLAGRDGNGAARFVAERLQYNADSGRIADFLGADADSLSRDAAGQRSELYGMRLDGQVFLEAGTHRFASNSDDGFRLTINGTVVAQHAGVSKGAPVIGTIAIDRAGWYDIGIDYYQAYSGAQLLVRHGVNGGQMQVLQGSDRLRHAVEGNAGPGGANTAPEARNDSYTLAEDGAIRMNLLANDRDADGDSLAITSLGRPANGQVTLNADGTVTYRPNADYHGRDSFTYTVSDGRGGSDTARVNLTVTPENDAPVRSGRAPASIEADEGEVLRIDLSTYFRDVDGDVLTYGVSGAGFARVQGNMLIVRPGEGHDGDYTLRITARDPSGASVALNLPLTVHETFVPPPVGSANRPPQAVNDRAAVNEDGSVRINLLANDSDPDGDRLSIASLGRPANGTVVNNGDGTVTYRPNPDYNGSDSFTYRVSDGNGGSAQATVTVNVRPVNDAPVAVDDSGFSVAAGGSLHFNGRDLLANDSDVDGDTLTIIGVENVSGGSAMLMGDGVHFNAGAAGTASFDYIISDGNGGTDRARVTIEVGGSGSGGGTGGGHGGDHGGGDHGGHGGHELIDPPQTAAEIRAFVRQVMSEPEHSAHHPNAAPDHDGSLRLVPRSEVTHVAINHGDWNDPSIWHNGEVPGADARVLIPQGIAVSYGEVNNASLFTVRVDGILDFATAQDSRMLVDTLVVSPSGHLIIGTEDDPVRTNVNVDIVFADNGNINTGWDGSLLSRGLLSHGSVTIHGAEKTSHVKVEVDAMAGDNRLVLSEVPEGWRVGDKLVLTGTHQQGWNWNNATRRTEVSESQDEEVTIRAINGNTIVLDRRLTYDHDTPRDDLKAYVANMTRNVTFSSEGGEDLPVHQRGHVMFMHSDDIDVRYAAFEDLGRTDKSRPAFDISDVGTVTATSNIQTRYPFHFHETGVSDLENPAIAIGNVVDGSPGWGYVHHSSNANFTNNVAFNVFGAAFVAEDGNETGIWYRNIAIKSEGIGYGDWTVKWESDVQRGDNGRTGDGFFFAGRLVEAAENVAANTTNGYVWLHRGDRDSVDMATSHHPELAYGQSRATTDTPPIQGFYDNEAFGTNTGLIVIKANPDQGHDVRSVFDGFLNWETREGINVSYTSHYTFLNVDLVGERGANGGYSSSTGAGILFGSNAFDMVVNGAKITGFQNAYDLRQNVSTDGVPAQNFRNTVIDAELSNIRGATAVEAVAGQLRQMDASQLVSDRLRFDFSGDRVISSSDHIFFDGTKYDSIGAVGRSFDMEQQGIWSWDKDALLSSNGFHRLPDGTPVLLVADYIADRATGQLSKHTLVFELDYSASQLSRFTDHGVVRLGGPAPIANNDRATTAMNQSVRIDLVANDRDPDGGRVYVDGLTDPRNGDVFLQDDGTVLYRPNFGFTGTDSFYYWAADEEGNFTRGRADIVVTEAMMMSAMAGSDMLEF